ncbi:MAG: NADH-quinone oxidoreductase subunit M [Elusimicrobia bacterium]|nr:NADH-quinone oxidoreductase subunit M [Elusimicrobiota bacterium]
MSQDLLTLFWVMPAVGGLCALLGRQARWPALAFSAATALYGLILLGPASSGAWHSAPVSSPSWAFGIRYLLDCDGLSLSLCWLTAFLTVACVIASWNKDYPPAYWAAFLFLESALLGVFLARDLFLFFVFWEAVLIPMFFIIGLWGMEGRRHAAMKFFLFTFFGSIFLLLGSIALVTRHHAATGVWTWDMAALKGPGGLAGLAIFAAMALGFAVKIPLVPLHTWLPDAHTEAPAAGSVMLAGVLLKMGVYGFLRILWPVFPKLSWELMPWLMLLAGVNVIYGALCAMAQKDLKRLIAYSSVAHLGFCLMGVLSRTPEGLLGGSLQLLNHGITTGALFLMVGFLYERGHRRGLGDYGELYGRAPWLTFFFGVATMSSVGLPGLNGFVGEFMSLIGVARVMPRFVFVGVIGVTLAAAYALPAFQSVFLGPAGKASVSAKVTDLDRRESSLLWALCGAMFAIGIYPAPLLRVLEPFLLGLVPAR